MNDVEKCLARLTLTQLKRLQNNLRTKHPLCGREEAADYFTFAGKVDILLLAIYENYPIDKDKKYQDLHPTAQTFYDIVTEHTKYSLALIEMTEYEIRRLVDLALLKKTQAKLNER